MTSIITATSMKDLPTSARVYYVGKDTPDQALAAYEKKYNRVPETAVIYKQYLYVEESEK